MNAFASQVPFALAKAMNDAAAEARKDLIERTWPSHMKVRNKAFLGAALRREFATKKDLRVVIAETGPAAGKGNLVLHAKGGARRARRANLAIPVERLQAKRTGKGIPKGMRPSALPNSFVRGDVIFQRVGKRKTKIAYVLRPSVLISADVPFERDFAAAMRGGVARAFRPRLQEAWNKRK